MFRTSFDNPGLPPMSEAVIAEKPAPAGLGTFGGVFTPSISQIATDQRIKTGGACYMISRAVRLVVHHWLR